MAKKNNVVRMIEVVSSVIDSFGYRNTVKELVVKISNRVYVYVGVPSDVFVEMVQADSIGTFYNSNIKGQYPCVRVSDYFPENTIDLILI